MSKFDVGDVVIIFFQVKGTEEGTRLERDAGVVTKVNGGDSDYMFQVESPWGTHYCDDYEIFHAFKDLLNPKNYDSNRRILLEANEYLLIQLDNMRKILKEQEWVQQCMAQALEDAKIEEETK